jgi:hypothetical protein
MHRANIACRGVCQNLREVFAGGLCRSDGWRGSVGECGRVSINTQSTLRARMGIHIHVIDLDNTILLPNHLTRSERCEGPLGLGGSRNCSLIATRVHQGNSRDNREK